MKDNVKVLWAKKPQKEDDPSEIEPLWEHLDKTADVAKKLWDIWLPPIIRSKIDKAFLVFLAYAHDIGKASPVFQTDERNSKTPQTNEKIRNDLRRAGFQFKDSYLEPQRTRHELVSYAILKRHGFDDSVCVVVGGHHGLPPNEDQIRKLDAYKSNCGFDCDVWKNAQDFIIEEALEKSRLTKEKAIQMEFDRPMQVLLSGIIILADWIVSSEYDVEKMPVMWEPQDLKNMYQERFGIESPRPVQEELIETVRAADSPGIFIVEAPMGEGKTEAALAAAEILARKAGCRGVYFALPSQATSNAMLTRVKNWIKTFHDQEGALSIRLSHGKADLNEEYEGIKLSACRYKEEGEESESAVIVHDWLSGRKKGIFADFTIGTIDHVLMAGLKQKHLVLRHLGLAKKVLIIDECHAYDVYMGSYLLKALKWLGAYGVPVIILSATLPTARRADIIRAYLGKSKEFGKDENWSNTIAYPLITYTNGDSVQSLPITTPTQGRSWQVDIEKVEDDNLLATLEYALANGGCAGVIFNTVKKAQEAFVKISEKFGIDNVELLHSGFIATDRAKLEKGLLKALGKNAEKRPKKRIIVGTQVFEQSLDIDFDVMFTELCPIDLFLQRIGRLHRHDRGVRPAGLETPQCYVLGANWGSFDKGSCYVYGEYLLMRTCATLPQAVNLPGDIPHLVASVYNAEAVVNVPEEYSQDYDSAQKAMNNRTKIRIRHADAYQIDDPDDSDDIKDWLNTFYRDSEGEAAVRDGMDTLEVLLIQRREDNLCFLPWVRNGEPLLPYHTPSDEQAKAIAGCSVRLPAVLNYNIDVIVKSIEEVMSNADIVDYWYKSHWLKGSLILILEEGQNVTLGGYNLHYSEQKGLSYTKEDKS